MFVPCTSHVPLACSWKTTCCLSGSMMVNGNWTQRMSGCCFYITVLPHVVVVVCELFSTKSGRGILPLTAPIPACLNIKLCSRAFFSPGTWMRKLCSGTCLRAELLCRYLLVFALFYSILYTAQTPWECRHYSFSKVLWLFAYKDIWLVLFCFFLLCPTLPICVTV